MGGENSIQYKMGRALMLMIEAEKESASNGHSAVAASIGEYRRMFEDLESQVTKYLFAAPVAEVTAAHRTPKIIKPKK